MPNMQRFFKILFLTFISVLGSCGKNNGTPQPVAKPPTDDARAAELPKGDLTWQLADGGLWRAEIIWDKDPRFSDDELLEMTGLIQFKSADGLAVRNFENVGLSADMPEHGHGTGRILPKTALSSAPKEGVTFSNLYFTMTGKWRIRVKATIDNKSDIWTTYVIVK